MSKFSTFQKSEIGTRSCIKKLSNSKMSHLTHLCGKEAVLASEPQHSRMNPSPLFCCNLPLFPSVATYTSPPSPLQPSVQGQPLKTGLQVLLLVPLPLHRRPPQTAGTEARGAWGGRGATTTSTRSLPAAGPTQVRCRHSNAFQLLALNELKEQL